MSQCGQLYLDASLWSVLDVGCNGSCGPFIHCLVSWVLLLIHQDDLCPHAHRACHDSSSAS